MTFGVCGLCKVNTDGRQTASSNVHSQFSNSQTVDETTSVICRAPLQSCANTRYEIGVFTAPEAPVLSSLAQQCLLRSGVKHK